VIEALFAFVRDWQAHGLAGLCVLALLFVAGTLSYMPRFSLYLIGGLVFGFAAIPAAIIGSTVGATAAFLLARTILRGPFERRVAARPAWRAALAAISQEGWRLVALTRIAAPLPGGAINYLYGLTRIGLLAYVTATAVGLIPPVTLFAGAGALGRFALADAEQSSGRGLTIGAGAAVIAIGVALILRRMRKTIGEAH
jgi:uncharacterized membrane protein YdjX (TVP38/TMEM64 family)